MQSTTIKNALIAGVVSVAFAGSALAALLPPSEPDPFRWANDPEAVDSAASDDTIIPLSHTDQGKAKGPQGISMPGYHPGVRVPGVDLWGEGVSGPDMADMILNDLELGLPGAPTLPDFSSAAALTRPEVIPIVTTTTGGHAVEPGTFNAVPGPGGAALLALAGIVGAGGRRRR